jgi:hypothetical protein
MYGVTRLKRLTEVLSLACPFLALLVVLVAAIENHSAWAFACAGVLPAIVVLIVGLALAVMGQGPLRRTSIAVHAVLLPAAVVFFAYMAAFSIAMAS